MRKVAYLLITLGLLFDLLVCAEIITFEIPTLWIGVLSAGSGFIILWRFPKKKSYFEIVGFKSR